MSQIVLDSLVAKSRRSLAHRAVGKAAALGFAAADLALAPLVPLLCPERGGEIPAVFIVGGPRSGSTLFYQAMVQSLRFAYISNDTARFPHSGPLAARLLRAERRRPHLKFDNKYGNTFGATGPSEAGRFWDLVFPWADEHTVLADEWPLERQHFARRHVGGFVDLFGAPFLCKNLWHSVRIEALNQAFPSAAFIVMRRDIVLMAQSIMQQQRSRQASGEGFWSIRPRGLAAKRHLPLAQQVAWQIVLTERAIAKARARLGQHRFFDLPYESFCDRPEAWLEQVGSFLQGLGIELHRQSALRQRFVAHRQCNLPGGERQLIEEVLREAA